MTHEEVPNDGPGWPLLLTHAELMTCLVSTETELGEVPSENLLQLGAWLSFLSYPGGLLDGLEGSRDGQKRRYLFLHAITRMGRG